MVEILTPKSLQHCPEKSMWSVSVLGQSARKIRDNAFGLGVSPDVQDSLSHPVDLFCHYPLVM